MSGLKKHLYLGFNEYGEAVGISIFIKQQGSVFIIIQRDSKNRKIPLSVNLFEKDKLIKIISQMTITKNLTSLDVITNKRISNYHYKYYPVSLSYLNDQYILSIQLPDSTFRFVIYNIEELISSLKEGMIFPGDKFVGLEAIELLDYRKGHWWWKAKCLLCNKITEKRGNDLKGNKSCGCLIGRNFNSDEERFYAKIDKQENVPKGLQVKGTLGIDEEPCWLWTGLKDKNEYGKFSIVIYKKHISIRSNRYALELKLGRKLLSEECALHRCDNPSCVNPNHLFVGTYKDNMQDKINKGRSNYLSGETHPNSKLNNQIVSNIRSIETFRKGDRMKLAKIHNVHVSTIVNVINRQTYKTTVD